MILFLDFNGVLHPREGDNRFTRLPLFEAYMRMPEAKKIRLIISSAWRQTHEIDRLRSFFSPDIALRIRGATPVLQTYRTRHQRTEEIKAWLSKHAARSWAALDDDIEVFAPALRPRLALCDGTVGLMEKDWQRVLRILAV
jgi:hypothetical protein